WSDGKHVIKWDGRIVKPTAEQKATITNDVAQHDLNKFTPDKSDKAKFPDGYVTLEHTPYKLKMTLVGKEGRGLPEIAWTYWHILIRGFELEIGAEDTVPKASDNQLKRDKAVRAKLVTDGGVPAEGATRKVILLSNVYKTSLAEMDNNAGHTEYETAWGDGPSIPIVAKIRLSDSQNREVRLESDKGAVALGHAKFLWDWEDPAEAVATQNTSARPKAFITNAIKYYNDGTDTTRSGDDHTYPKGDNCHVDHGGKRGPGAKAVFPVQKGYDAADALKAGEFPFPVTATKKRKWAALSEGWGSGALKGRTGVVFQPSRMAGDDYKLSVYLAYDKLKKDELALDVVTEPLVCPTAIKSTTTGTFQVWREIHIARYVKKRTAMTTFLPTNLAGVQTHMQMAYIDVLDKMDGAKHSYAISAHKKADGSAPDYNTLIRARLTGTGNALVTADLITDSTFDHSTDESMFEVRTYADFVQAVHLDQNPGVAAAANDLARAGINAEALGTADLSTLPAGSRKTRLEGTQSWLVSWAAETRTKYAGVADDIGFGIGEPFSNDFELITGGKTGSGEAPHGVTTVHYNFTNSYLRQLFDSGVGVGYWYGAAIDTTDADRNRCVIIFWMAGVDEFSHEYGHHLFLPHAKYPLASPPGGAQANRHDDPDSGCLMSYSSVRPAFCGLCQLRMRGWSATNLSNISANNKKP
ncbi:MAG TPA: hypothetical protein VIP11_11315, partial [Gemmatimonadaceae bacterium]